MFRQLSLIGAFCQSVNLPDRLTITESSMQFSLEKYANLWK